MNDTKPHIAIAMSGGVDSSVAAMLLVEKGFDVFAVMMRLWSASAEIPNRCCSPNDVISARTVATMFEIPFHVLDMSDKFKSLVVDSFTDAYSSGVTPNPCLTCNRIFRWELLLEEIKKMGGTHLATGHYARIEKNKSEYRLLRGRDLAKDQSYVLSVLGQSELAQTMFPLGDLTKDEVRQLARRSHLPVAEKPDSQDLCFVPDGDYRDFLRQQAIRLPPPGPIVDTDGSQLGFHDGLSNYTIGQRKGIGLSASEALYVIDKKVDTNTLIVGPRSALGRTAFTAGPINWVAGHPPVPETPLAVRIRYQAMETACSIRIIDNNAVDVHLEQPIADITPGQSAVFYSGEICLGGGIIHT